jgi:SAM-dependent methyltransferase
MNQQHQGGFTSEQRDQAYPLGSEAHFWFQARNRILHDRVADAASDAAVLDIGCGPGTTVAYLRERGIECYGCDLSSYPPMDAGIAPYVFYERDALTLPGELRERVGAMLLLDVLEHMSDPTGFLEECIAAFPRAETLLITLPARMELWSEYDAHFGHQRRFDLGSAAEICALPSLEVVESAYFFHALYPILWLTRNASGRRTTPPVRWPRLHALLGRLLQLESRWLPARWPGSSLLIALRRRAAADTPGG